MAPFRTLLLRHRALALLIVAAALAMKALVPAGVMLGSEGKVLTVEICADTLGTHLTRQIVLAPSGKSGGESGAAKSAASCPFGALAMAGLGGADAVLLAAALAFVVALGLMSLRAAPASAPSRWRPPLRAPPLHA